MSVFNKIKIIIKCNHCNVIKEIEDELKISGMRQEKCNDYDIKIIKNIEDNNEVIYSFSFNGGCKKHEMIQFKFRKDDNNQDSGKYLTFDCKKCKKQVSLQLILLKDETEEKEKEKEMNKKDQNKNIFVNNVNPNNFNNNNNNILNNNNFNNNNIMNNNFNNNINNFPYMNNFMNNNMNNNFNNMMNNNNNYMMKRFMANNNMNPMMMNNNNMFQQFPNNNQMGFNIGNNNLMGMNSPNQENIDDTINILMSNLNINNNDNSITIFVQIGSDKFEKKVQKNKVLKDIFREIQKEKPDLKDHIDNIRNNIVMCNGEAIVCTKTIAEINKEKEIIGENSVIIVPNIKTQRIFN